MPVMPVPSAPPPLRNPRRKLLAATAALLAVPAAASAALAPAVAAPSRSSAVGAVVSWNATATDALVTDAAMLPAVAAVGVAYVQAAVYNAVVGIEGQFAEYRWDVNGPADASVPAAVAAAAHRVLLTYVPVARPRVEAAYTDTLAAIPESRAKHDGIRFGERAAAHLIAQRKADGWLAPTTYNRTPAPGVWRPTPPSEAPFASAFLGRMRPFLLTRHDQLRPEGPPALRSKRYAADFNEVKRLGAADSTARSPAQTDTALFFGTNNLMAQLQSAYRDFLTRHRFGAVSAARYLAAVNLAGADAAITAWDSKLRYAFWRPITAIRHGGTDHNPGTSADPNWTPLQDTPPFPDYLSGHTTTVGAITAALTGLLHTQRIDLTLPSLTSPARHYSDAARLNADSVGARIWAGIHFRTADEVGNRIGKEIGRYAIQWYFQPLG